MIGAYLKSNKWITKDMKQKTGRKRNFCLRTRIDSALRETFSSSLFNGIHNEKADLIHRGTKINHSLKGNYIPHHYSHSRRDDDTNKRTVTTDNYSAKSIRLDFVLNGRESSSLTSNGWDS